MTQNSKNEEAWTDRHVDKSILDAKTSEFNKIKNDKMVQKSRIKNPESFLSDSFLFKRTSKNSRPSKGSKRKNRADR